MSNTQAQQIEKNFSQQMNMNASQASQSTNYNVRQSQLMHQSTDTRTAQNASNLPSQNTF